MSKRASIVLAVALYSALLLAFLFIRHIAATSSLIVPRQNVGPEMVARNLFEQRFQLLGVPLYRDVTTRVLRHHRSCATVEVVATMFQLTRAGVQWLETPCDVDCVFSAGQWQCAWFECYPDEASRWARHVIQDIRSQRVGFITNEATYPIERRIHELGWDEEDRLRSALDDAAELIASPCYDLDDVANPQLIARLIADYAGRYGFSVEDIQNLEVRQEVEGLLESGDY